MREPSVPHLAFGNGAHYCIGLHLARAEVRIAYEQLMSRLGEISLDTDRGPIEYLASPVVRIPKAVPLRFTTP
jgi:cytochrome P450